MMVTSPHVHLAEFGIVAPVGRNAIGQSLEVVADAKDTRLPEIARACVTALGTQLLALKAQILAFDRRIMAWHDRARRAGGSTISPASVRRWPPLWPRALLIHKAFRSGRDFSAWIATVPNSVRLRCWPSGYEEYRNSRSTAAKPAKRPEQHVPMCRASATDRREFVCQITGEQSCRENLQCPLRPRLFFRARFGRSPQMPACSITEARSPPAQFPSAPTRPQASRSPDWRSCFRRGGLPRLLASPIYSSAALPDDVAASYFPREVAAAVHRSVRAVPIALME
jgi:hypothetical protein